MPMLYIDKKSGSVMPSDVTYLDVLTVVELFQVNPSELNESG